MGGDVVTASVLLMPEVFSEELDGDYTCMAMNPFGMVSRTITVSVRSKCESGCGHSEYVGWVWPSWRRSDVL